jgi:hypothetical protein
MTLTMPDSSSSSLQTSHPLRSLKNNLDDKKVFLAHQQQLLMSASFEIVASVCTNIFSIPYG